MLTVPRAKTDMLTVPRSQAVQAQQGRRPMTTELLSDGGSLPPHSGEEAMASSAPCPVLAEMPLVCGFGSWAKSNTR